MLRNRNIERGWKYETKFANEFHLVLVEGTPNVLKSGVDTDVVLAELSTFGVNALTMSATGDTVRTMLAWPSLMDIGTRLLMRVLWTSDSTTTTDTVTWLAKYRYLSLNNDVLSGTVATELDTPITVDTYGSGTAYRLCATPWGEIDPGNIQASDPVQLEIEMDAKSGPTNVYFIGVQFAFVPSISTDYGAIQPGLVNPS